MFDAAARYDRLHSGIGAACGESATGMDCYGRWVDYTGVPALAQPIAPPPAPGTLIDIGGSIGCMLESGVLSCVGAGFLGGLGPSFQIVYAPTQHADDVAILDTGPRHTCLVDDAGEVRCFGSNDRGPFRSGPTFRTLSPVPELSPAKALSLGESHTCAIDLAGDLRCLSHDGTAPVAARGPFSMAAGDYELHCALREDGAILCRGLPFSTQDFVLVNAPGPATYISGAGLTMCGVFEGGTVACFGSNDDQLIIGGGAGPVSVPVPIPGLRGMRSLTVTLSSACALAPDGQAHCWNPPWPTLSVDGASCR